MFLHLFIAQLTSLLVAGTLGLNSGFKSGSTWTYHGPIDNRTNIPSNVSLTSVLGSLDPDVENNTDSDSDSYAAPTPAGSHPNDTIGKDKSKIARTSLATSAGGKRTYGKYGTTRHLKEIFFGRCYEYQYRKTVIEENERDCNKLWDLFYNAFAHKGPCDVTSEDYKLFLDEIDEQIDPNKGLLWSGTRELAHKYSDFLYTRKYTTLEDTLVGYLLNGLTWCGHEKDGMNFKECPWKCSLQSPYWSTANTRFAQKLRGLVHIILNGTRIHLNDGKTYPAFMKDRYYLGPDVIPVLNKKNIKKIIIVVAHTLNLKPLETCGVKSVQYLLEEILKKGIPVECYNDPDSTKYMLCSSNPNAKECLHMGTKRFIPTQIGHLLPMLSGSGKTTEKQKSGKL